MSDSVTRVLPAPADGVRVETGPVQFGNDWPGLFIRGDNAKVFSLALREALDQYRSQTPGGASHTRLTFFFIRELEHLHSLLESTEVKGPPST